MLQFIKEMLSEESGKPSIKRVIVFLLTLVFVTSYIRVIFLTTVLEDIPNNWLVLFLGVLGIMVTGRTIEKIKQWNQY